MATYVLLSSLTPEGGQTLHAHPERLAEVNKEIDNFGCQVVSQYALLGDVDFLTVIEAPSNEVIAKISVELGARGGMNGMTMAAIPLDEFVAGLERTGQRGKKKK
jgi:uncharacterized protein with GYD domain